MTLKKSPILYVSEIIGGKWKMPILYHIGHAKTIEFSVLRTQLQYITNHTLDKNLKELMIDRLVLCDNSEGEVYSLTSEGKSLLQEIDRLCDWGIHFEQIRGPRYQ